MTAMKKRMILATLSSLLLCMAACSNKQLPTSEDILTEARAVKTLNAYDEMNCVVYDMKVTPASPKSSIDRFVSDDCVEGAGSFEQQGYIPFYDNSRCRHVHPGDTARQRALAIL